MRYEEIIVTLEGSGYLFLLFAWRTRAMTAAMSMQNWKIPSHVTSIPVTPSRLRLGAKKHHPRQNRGEPPTGVLPAAPETAYHKIRQIARKTPVRVVRKYPTQQNAPAAQCLRRRGQLLLLFHQISQRYAIEIAADAFVQLAPDRQRRAVRRAGTGLRAAL